jgi:uncharacterized membrane protein
VRGVINLNIMDIITNFVVENKTTTLVGIFTFISVELFGIRTHYDDKDSKKDSLWKSTLTAGSVSTAVVASILMLKALSAYCRIR